jgi:hypothetical protein
MRNLLLICFLIIFQFSVNAKSLKGYLEVKKDSNYIESYFNEFIVWMYSGEKTHSLELNDLNNSYHFRYLPNGYFNLGAGFSYRWFGISLATKIPIFQNSSYKHGDTKRFGIQSYIYAGKFSIDILTSFSRGYYLKRSYLYMNSFSKQLEYQRPDISSLNLGISVNYIFNNSRFSYKAAFSDNEKQKKNAGSLIAGGSIFSYQTIADSAFVPSKLSSDYFQRSRDVSKSGVLACNANLGYAYSFVFLKNGIFTLSYILGSGVQNNSFEREIAPDVNRWRFSVNHTGRVGVGYRFNLYYVRFGIIRSTQYTSLKYNDLGIANGTNFMQISVGRRIANGRN